MMCFCDTVRGKYVLYSGVCLRYRVREMLLCTVMFIWGRGWGKFYCVHWCAWGTVWGKCYCVHCCVSELQGEWNVTVYTDVCLRYRVREILLCRVRCVWGTGWRKIYCIQWCVSEVQGEWNITMYSDVFLRKGVKEMLLPTEMCVWGTGWGKYYFAQWCVSEVHVDGNIIVYTDVSVHQLITSIWISEEIPEDWNWIIICPIHKKGYVTICENYRGISLLCVAYKIFSHILFNRLLPYMEATIVYYQCGYRQGRSTIDQIFTVRQILEKCNEHNKVISQRLKFMCRRFGTLFHLHMSCEQEE